MKRCWLPMCNGSFVSGLTVAVLALACAGVLHLLSPAAAAASASGHQEVKPRLPIQTILLAHFAIDIEPKLFSHLDRLKADSFFFLAKGNTISSDFSISSPISSHSFRKIKRLASARVRSSTSWTNIARAWLEIAEDTPALIYSTLKPLFRMSSESFATIVSS